MLLQASFVFALAAAASAFSVPSDAADGVYVTHADKSSGSFIHFPLNTAASPSSHQISKNSLASLPVARNEKLDFLNLNNTFASNFRLKPVHPAAKGDKHLPTGIFNSTSYGNSLNATGTGPVVLSAKRVPSALFNATALADSVEGSYAEPLDLSAKHVPSALFNATALADSVEGSYTEPLDLSAKHLPEGILNTTLYGNSLNGTGNERVQVVVSDKHLSEGVLSTTSYANRLNAADTKAIPVSKKHLPAGILNTTSFANNPNATDNELKQVVAVSDKHLPVGIYATQSYINSLNTASTKHLPAGILNTISYTNSLNAPLSPTVLSARASSPSCTGTYRLPLADINLALTNLRNQMGGTTTIHAGQHYYSVVGDVVAYVCNHASTVTCDAQDVSQAHDAIAGACKVGKPGEMKVRAGMVVGFGGRSEDVCGESVRK